MDMEFVRVRKALVNDGSQLDLIAIAQESRQSCLDQHRFGNLQRRAGIPAESAFLGPSQAYQTDKSSGYPAQ